MGMQINTNVAALNAYRNLGTTQNSLNSSLEKLSSGLRINRAADDAAGLVISEGLRSQVSGLKVAARNAQDGISVVQTAEGALNQVHSILHRMRDLAVQAGNDTNSDDARTAIAAEATSLNNELGRIADSTNFNGKKLLDGSVTSLNFQVGSDGNAEDRINVSLAGADVSAVKDALTNGRDVLTATVNAATTTGNWVFTQGGAAITVAMGAVDATRTNGDVVDTLNGNAAFANNFTAALNSDGLVTVTSKLSTTNTTVTGTGYTSGTNADGTLDFSTHSGAQAALSAIDAQIESVSTARATLGVAQNRFQYAIDNINVSVENLSASESRIRDTDMAMEMANYTKSQILQQAGVAMLAQANNAPQSVLRLLQG